MKAKLRAKRGLPPLPDEPDEVEPTDVGELPSHLNWIWTAFAVLSRTRTVNQTGPQPIALRDLESYCNLESIWPDHRSELLYHVTVLDIEWCKEMHQRMETTREEQKRQAEKDAKRKGRR